MTNPTFERPPDTYHFTGEQLAQQDGNHLAQVGIDLSERAGFLQTEATQTSHAEQLLRAQSELVNADNPNRFHLAQRRLESGGGWTEETRLLALEVNRADQEQRGERPLSFDEAKTKVESWATSDIASEDKETKRNGLQLDSALRGLDRPDTSTQRESLDTMLKDVEQTLAGYERGNVARTPSYEAEVREYRAIRDALLLKQTEIKSSAERRAKERAENIDRDTHVADARDKIAQAHGEVTHTQQNEQSVETTAEDQKAQLLAMVPNAARDRILFAKQNFAEISADKIPLLSAYLQKEVAGMAAGVPEGSRYPDTIAAVLGNGGEAWHFLRAVVSAQRGGQVLDPNAFSRLPFSEVADSLGIDVKKLIPDYEQRFRTL